MVLLYESLGAIDEKTIAFIPVTTTSVGSKEYEGVFAHSFYPFQQFSEVWTNGFSMTEQPDHHLLSSISLLH